MAVKQLQNVYSFRKIGLTCHKWKANTTKLKGIGEADDPDKRVGEADNPNEADDLDEGVSEADDLDKGIDEANDPNEADDPNERVGETNDPNEVDDPDEGVDEADDLTWPCLVSTFAYIYIEISCAPRLVLIKKTSTRKGLRKIRS